MSMIGSGFVHLAGHLDPLHQFPTSGTVLRIGREVVDEHISVHEDRSAGGDVREVHGDS